MNKPLSDREFSRPADWDRRGLPGWTYHSADLLELEKRLVFRRHWQIIGHVSDVPQPGDYLSLDIVGERAFAVRGQDGVVRAFLNMCRHRGSRVVTEEKGSCRGALVCPFHGWVYNLDGTLRGAARPKTFPPLDRNEFGLKPIETEIWNGLIFIRLEPGPQPSVAELMRPFADEIAAYRLETMVPTEAGMWTQVSDVNWKSVRDVDNEGYHVAMAHPALQDLYGPSYHDEPFVDGVSRSFATTAGRSGRRWSVKNYLKMVPKPAHLPPDLQEAWVYWGLFPNTVIAVTPVTMQFYQEFPLSTDRTLLRGIVYRYPDETREQRLARYLTLRIDRDTQAEDVQLTEWSNEALKSPSFDGFYLSDLEYGVRSHHDHLRAILPVMTLETSPGEGAIEAVNARMETDR